MKQIIIPIILVATVVITGFFAFTPVEQASTIHSTLIGGDGGVLSLQKELEDLNDPGDEATWTFSADEDTIITSIWLLAEEGYCITEFSFGDLVFRGSGRNFEDSNTTCEAGDTSDLQDFLQIWENNGNIGSPMDWSEYMPLDHGDELVITLIDDDDVDFQTNGITIWIGFQRGGGATLV